MALMVKIKSSCFLSTFRVYYSLSEFPFLFYSVEEFSSFEDVLPKICNRKGGYNFFLLEVGNSGMISGQVCWGLS